MAHCGAYWEIVKRNEQLFHRVNLLKSQVAVPVDRETFKALEQEYIATLERLDQHTITCPVCSEITVDAADSRAR